MIDDWKMFPFDDVIMGYCVRGPFSISDKTPYCKISQSPEAAKFVSRIIQSIALKIDRHLDSTAGDAPLKF